MDHNCLRDLFESIGEDPQREGLVDTPGRFADFFHEVCTPETFKFTTFTNEGQGELIAECNIPFYSLCEHHLAPFFGVAHVGYIPDQSIAGLSKLARTVEYFARGLQNQERITSQVNELIEQQLSPLGSGVVISARHLCMEMRGVKKPNTYTTTKAFSGRLRHNPTARAEFMQTINHG